MPSRTRPSSCSRGAARVGRRGVCCCGSVSRFSVTLLVAASHFFRAPCRPRAARCLSAAWARFSVSCRLVVLVRSARPLFVGRATRCDVRCLLRWRHVSCVRLCPRRSNCPFNHDLKSTFVLPAGTGLSFHHRGLLTVCSSVPDTNFLLCGCSRLFKLLLVNHLCHASGFTTKVVDLQNLKPPQRIQMVDREDAVATI